MLCKARDKNDWLEQHKVLSSRISPNHPKQIEINKVLVNLKTGFKGEMAIDYPLSFLPQNDFYIFHDLRLQYQDHFFQLDSFILTCRYGLILEIKNYYGTLLFDPDFSQLTGITDDGKEDGFPDPITQIERHNDQLTNWIRKQHFSDLPILAMVIISFPSTIIKALSQPEKIAESVSHSAKLPFRIKDLDTKYQNQILKQNQLNDLSNMLINAHVPKKQNILKYYELSPSDIIKGVKCPECVRAPMKWKNGSWYCRNCNVKSKTEHFTALKDYYYLYGPNITNRRMREFLCISSESTAKRILTSMSLPYIGNTKNRVYFLNDEN